MNTLGKKRVRRGLILQYRSENKLNKNMAEALILFGPCVAGTHLGSARPFAKTRLQSCTSGLLLQIV